MESSSPVTSVLPFQVRKGLLLEDRMLLNRILCQLPLILFVMLSPGGLNLFLVLAVLCSLAAGVESRLEIDVGGLIRNRWFFWWIPVNTREVQVDPGHHVLAVVPLRITTKSTHTLVDQSSILPTVFLTVEGNERDAIHLKSSLTTKALHREWVDQLSLELGLPVKRYSNVQWRKKTSASKR